jgi:hypothetical protein
VKALERVEAIVKKEMIQTIISLILAYEGIKNEEWGQLCNLKNAIFILMILEAQNTKTVQKNDIVIIKQELTTIINMNLGWKSEELEAFFNNYTSMHTEEVLQGLEELESQAVIESEKEAQDFCIQINGPDKEIKEEARKEMEASAVRMSNDRDRSISIEGEDPLSALSKSLFPSIRDVEGI